MLTTAFTETFGVRHPIVQGGMQWVGRAELVAAVANAGALGMLTALTQPTPDDLAREISRTRELTDQPFGVNLTILPTITPPPYDEYRNVIIDCGVKVVETAGSSPRAPSAALSRRRASRFSTSAPASATRSKPRPSVSTASASTGSNVPGIQGKTTYRVSFSSLQQQRADQHSHDRVRRIFRWARISGGPRARRRRHQHGYPVHVHRGVRPIHRNIKEAIVAASEVDTELIFQVTTQYRTGSTQQHQPRSCREILSSGGKFEDVRHLVAGARGRAVFDSGDQEAGIWTAGTVQGLIHDIPTVGELVERIVTEAEALIAGRLTGLLDPVSA